MNSAQITFTNGMRVRFVGTFGDAAGPIGKVWRVTSSGVWVTFPKEDGGRQLCHPEDIRPVGAR